MAVRGATGFYIAAGMSLLVSVDTSWRFFGEVLGITGEWERAVMFTVLETSLLAVGYGMRANVVAHGTPGSLRFFAWGLCSIAGLMAWELSGVAEGVARVVLGPVLGLIMLHLALGIELRAGSNRTSVAARVLAELRERLLSRLGLGDDGRDAASRTRDRAALRAARLAAGKPAAGSLRARRLARALRVAGVSHDRGTRTRLLTELAVLQHADALTVLEQQSPWVTPAPAPRPTRPAPAAPSAKVPPAKVSEPSPARVEPLRAVHNDEEIVADIRRQLAHGTVTKRDVMSKHTVGSDRAVRLLRAARNATEEAS